MQVKIDGRICIDRAEFAKLLGLTVHSGFDQRRLRDSRAGLWFPDPYTTVHGHPFWLLVDAERYVRIRLDRRTRNRIPLRRKPEQISA